MITRKVFLALIALGLLLIGGQARALILDPSDMIAGYGYGPSNCEPSCIYDVFELSADPVLSLLYKADAENGGVKESGSFAGWYETFFYNETYDPSNAILDQEGDGYIVCPECYLAVKDGNASPGYYFYDLSGWNGMDAIHLLDFWPGSDRGAISHIAIWGRNVTSVPEPGPLALLGVGLLAITLASRKRRIG